MKNQELEVKFYVRDLERLEQRLQALGAEPVQARVREINLRFDTAENELTRSYRVLRLRQDEAARVTYKGPGRSVEGVRVREEIEYTVSDFASAQALFEALGYQVSLIYEKFRATYDLDGTHVTLDEMPYGSFAEVEGPEPTLIQSVARKLELDWEARVSDSYTALFSRLQVAHGLEFRDLTFKNFQGRAAPLEVLGLHFADR